MHHDPLQSSTRPCARPRCPSPCPVAGELSTAGTAAPLTPLSVTLLRATIAVLTTRPVGDLLPLLLVHQELALLAPFLAPAAGPLLVAPPLLGLGVPLDLAPLRAERARLVGVRPVVVVVAAVGRRRVLLVVRAGLVPGRSVVGLLRRGRRELLGAPQSGPVFGGVEGGGVLLGADEVQHRRLPRGLRLWPLCHPLLTALVKEGGKVQ